MHGIPFKPQAIEGSQFELIHSLANPAGDAIAGQLLHTTGILFGRLHSVDLFAKNETRINPNRYSRANLLIIRNWTSGGAGENHI